MAYMRDANGVRLDTIAVATGTDMAAEAAARSAETSALDGRLDAVEADIDGWLSEASLSGTYAPIEAMGLLLSKQPGIDPTGLTDSSAALQLIINATAAAGKRLIWDCKVYSASTRITIPDNFNAQGFGRGISQLICGWTLVGTAPQYLSNANTGLGTGNVGIRMHDIEIVGANTAANNPLGVAGGPWGNATTPVVAFSMRHCSDFDIRLTFTNSPGISCALGSCCDGKADITIYGGGRDGLNVSYYGGEMRDLDLAIRAKQIGDDGVNISSSPSGTVPNGTAVTVATTAGSNAIIASAPAGWTSGQTIVIAGAGELGALPIEGTLTVTDSTHATIDVVATTTVAAASAWYGVYRPYNIHLRKFDINGQPNGSPTRGSSPLAFGRGLYLAGCDITLGTGVIANTAYAGVMINGDQGSTALWSKITGGDVTILNPGVGGQGLTCSTTNGSGAIVAAAAQTWTTGQSVLIKGAGASGADLTGTLTVTDSTHATVSVNAGATITAAQGYWGTSVSQPRTGVNVDGCRRLTGTNARVEGSVGSGIYATDYEDMEWGSVAVYRCGTVSNDYSVNLDGAGTAGGGTTSRYSGNRCTFGSLHTRRNASNGLRCNYVRNTVVGKHAITDNGTSAALGGNGWGVQFSGDGNTELIMGDGVITDSKPTGSKTQTGSILYQAGSGARFMLSNIKAYGNQNSAPSLTNGLVVRRGFIADATNNALNFDQDMAGAYRITSSGAPEGAVAAPVGSVYTRIDGGAATSFYVKESGSGNTGWVAK